MSGYDIIVVGAGPGGSVAAKTAAENGFSTLLLEKESLSESGRYKACGGAMAWELVEEIDYPEDKIGRVIDSLELHHTNGETYSKSGKGAVVWRSIFDKYLTEMATDSGAVLRDNNMLLDIKKKENKYEIRTNKEKYLGKYVVAADGVASRTLKRLGWTQFKGDDLILTITKELKSSKLLIDEKLGSNKVHLFFGIKDLIPVGYAWLFPKENHITVGWGNQINLIKNSRKEFNKFINLPIVRDKIHNCSEEIFKPHLIPVGIRPQLYEDQVIAVGDAGGIVDPISGKGIPYAMMSGEIAIKNIKKCINREKIEKIGKFYRKDLDRKFLKILSLKREARDRIFKDDESLKKFLALWENHRSSEIVMKGMI
ncbi:MAG: geranylgeranyl reductase family protein [Candidatus Lokiarchaeota archaeon]|nr:geranylgeranyl reductase family protein [Candidatus Lokiarchaeota archaeon]MBD3200413.1 geranylgeranyl reductase family protein [Candidatus Lokiarchaeota archaeon]